MVAHPWFVVLALFMLVSSGCADSPPTQPDDTSPLFAKGGGTVSVTAADPSFGKQGASGLVVRVLGSGFDAGSRASWERGGVPDPAISVNVTSFVSSSELRVTIDIAPNAVLAFYDVAVYTAGGRKGIGTEKFEVTTAEPVGEMGTVHAINDAGQLVGFNRHQRAAYYDPADGITVDLGADGVAFDLDRNGQMLVGQRTAGAPLYWIRSANGWQMNELPSFGEGGAGRALASDAAGTPWMVAGHVFEPTGKRQRTTRPVRWTRTVTGWTLELLPRGAHDNGMAWGVNSLGMVVGHVGATFQPSVWDSNKVLTVLATLGGTGSGEARDINADGTIVVGSSNNRPVIWTRNQDGSWDPAPVDLDAPFGVSCTGYQRALDINAAGIVVGMSCGQAHAWRVSGRNVLSRLSLGGLGAKVQEASFANAINDASPAQPAGRAFTNLGEVDGVGVIWPGVLPAQ